MHTKYLVLLLLPTPIDSMLHIWSLLCPIQAQQGTSLVVQRYMSLHDSKYRLWPRVLPRGCDRGAQVRMEDNLQESRRPFRCQFSSMLNDIYILCKIGWQISRSIVLLSRCAAWMLSMPVRHPQLVQYIFCDDVSADLIENSWSCCPTRLHVGIMQGELPACSSPNISDLLSFQSQHQWHSMSLPILYPIQGVQLLLAQAVRSVSDKVSAGYWGPIPSYAGWAMHRRSQSRQQYNTTLRHLFLRCQSKCWSYCLLQCSGELQTLAMVLRQMTHSTLHTTFDLHESEGRNQRVVK